MMNMKAVILEAPGRISVREIPRPSLASDEVLLKVKACGICGSDVRYIKGDNPWAKQTLGIVKRFKGKMVLGHEFSGEIVKVGNPSLENRIGERVGTLVYKGCGTCHYCRMGKHNLCAQTKHLGHSQGWENLKYNPGGMAEYCQIWAEMAFPLPENISYENAAMLDCVQVAVHAIEIAQLPISSKIAIIGLGAIGQFILQVSQVSSGAEVFCIDIREKPLRVATESGAKLCINSVIPRSNNNEAISMEGSMDAVFDMVGSQETLIFGLKLLKRGGKLILLAGEADSFSIPTNLLTGERSIITSANSTYPNFQESLDLLVSGKVHPQKIITHRFPLSEAKKAFEVAANKDKYEAIKVLIIP